MNNVLQIEETNNLSYFQQQVYNIYFLVYNLISAILEANHLPKKKQWLWKTILKQSEKLETLKKKTQNIIIGYSLTIQAIHVNKANIGYTFTIFKKQHQALQITTPFFTTWF